MCSKEWRRDPGTPAKAKQPKDERGRWTTWFEWKIRRWTWTVLILAIFLVLGMLIGGVVF